MAEAEEAAKKAALEAQLAEEAVEEVMAAEEVMVAAFWGDTGEGGLNARTAAIIIGMFLYIGGYQVSFGPIAWLLISEIFPLGVRDQAISVAVFTNFPQLACSEDYVGQVRDLVVSLLQDENMTVRQKSAKILGGLLHSGFLAGDAVSTLLADIYLARRTHI